MAAGACCSVCGKAYSSSHLHHHSPAPGEAPGIGTVCNKCKRDSLVTSGGGGDVRSQHVASDSHDVQVRKKGDQIQIRIFSDSERKGRRPANAVVLQHRKSTKRTESVPARPDDTGHFAPARSSQPSSSRRRRSLSGRRSPSRPISFPAEGIHDPSTGEDDFPLSDTYDHHLAYRLQKTQLNDRGRPPRYSPTSSSSIESSGKRYSHYKTDEEEPQGHNSRLSKVHRRYRSADISGADLQPNGGPTYQARLTHLPDSQDEASRQRSRWRRSDSGESTDAVVGSPHVHFGRGVSRQRMDISDSSDLPRKRRRPRVTEEIDRLLGPDSDDEGKGKGGSGLPALTLILKALAVPPLAFNTRIQIPDV
ncbi:MAG: hypothetical protein M1813_002824 [Trichoglossum hirsutum]|nr:MAG: hypothetical protein M1813_002824 [Trichoglossum hirsutum]